MGRGEGGRWRARVLATEGRRVRAPKGLPLRRLPTALLTCRVPALCPCAVPAPRYVQQVLRITANMRSESMAGMARGRRLLRAPTMPPGPDRNPASGEPLTQLQQRRAAAAAAAAVPWARRPVGKASWQVQRSTGSLSWPPPGSRQASSFDIDRLASV